MEAFANNPNRRAGSRSPARKGGEVHIRHTYLRYPTNSQQI